MFENFPYTDMHQLNLDWIIKIAKDFLDKYTQIQETISTGLTDLDNEKERLEQLLQEWYDTHSQDIADQLADALNTISNNLQSAMLSFNALANQKTQQSIASIPDDYTEVDYRAKWNYKAIAGTALMKYSRSPVVMNDLIMQQGKWRHSNPGESASIIVAVEAGDNVKISPTGSNNMNYCLVNNLNNMLTDQADPAFATGYTGTVTTNQITTLTIPEGCHYLYCLSYSAGTVYIPSSILINGIQVLNTFDQNYNTMRNIIDYKLPVNTRDFLVNWADFIDNYFINENNGNLVFSEDYSTTNFIDVRAIPSIGISRRILRIAYYDINKNFISAIVLPSGNHDFAIYNVPSNAYYVRLTVYQPKKSVTFISLIQPSNKSPIGDITVNKDANTDPDFTTIRKAAEFANQYLDTNVFISADTYNILEEFETELNSLPLTSQIGIGLGNGTKLIGTGGKTHIYCPYNGADQSVISYLSPIYALTTNTLTKGGYTIENIKIVSTNCRYSVHDDYGSFAKPIFTKMLNCRFIHSDENAGSLANYYPQCIGGGFGTKTYIDIENCYFSSARYINSVGPAVSYHNTAAANSESTLYMRNCYFEGKATMRCGSFGESTQYSKVTINNCSCGAAPYNTPYDASENLEMLSFMNEIH